MLTKPNPRVSRPVLLEPLTAYTISVPVVETTGGAAGGLETGVALRRLPNRSQEQEL